MNKSVLAGSIALSLLNLNAQALSVGKMKVDSFLGEPLNLTIDINSITKNELSTLEVSLASRALFKQAGIAYPNNADSLRFSVNKAGSSKASINVQSLGAISDPFVDLLLNIEWAGGTIVREYAALIDPANYAPSAIAQAASPNTTLRPVQATNSSTQKKNPEVHGKVKRGDSLSAIAALYRPTDVSMQQAWIAFYNLNRHAFPENNINSIKVGSNIKIPSRDQMLALSTREAVKQVKSLSKRPRLKTKPKSAVASVEDKPQLIVGTGASNNTAAAEEVDSNTASSSGRSSAQSIVQSNASSTQQASGQGAADSASVFTELNAFKDSVTREMGVTRDQNNAFKEELIATRGENRVLNERLIRLESQLGRISELLELQGQALQTINSGSTGENQGVELTLTQPVQNPPEVLSDQQAYEEMVDRAISGDPAAQSTAADPTAADAAIPEDVSDQEAYDALVDRAISGDPATGVAVNIEQDGVADVASLSNEELAQVQQGEAQIAKLEQELADKVQATQAQQASSTADQGASTRIKQSDSSLLDNAKQMFSSVGDSLGGLSSNLWMFVLALFGFLALLFGFRKRRASDSEGSVDVAETNEDSTVGMMDSALSNLNELDDLDDQLHGSSLFDLSDESFMASEALENDSSLFALDEMDDMFAQDAAPASTTLDQDSALEKIDQQSTITHVVDVDPIAEAEVYLAYDRKEEAVEVLQAAIKKDPNQPEVVTKLLSLYQGADDKKAFTELFESSAEHIEDESEWGAISQMAREFVPEHSMLSDDFDASIPVLTDEVDDAVTNSDVTEDQTSDSVPLDVSDQDSDSFTLDFGGEDSDSVSVDVSGEDSDSLSLDMGVLESEKETESSTLDMLDDSESITFELDEQESDVLNVDNEASLEIDDVKTVEEPTAAPAEIDMDDDEQHDPETALALAKAYIDLGENSIAQDFLNDVISAAAEGTVKAEAESLLKSIS